MSSKAPIGNLGNFPYPEREGMVSYLQRHDWMETEYGMWQHPDHDAFGFGYYALKDAYKQAIRHG